MKKSDQLKQTRSAKLEKWQGIVDAAGTENRAFTEDENTQIETLRNEVKTLDTQIEAQEDLENRQAAAAAAAGTTVESDDGEAKEKRHLRDRFSITKMFRDGMRGNLSGAEKEVQEIAIEENRAAKINFDDDAGSAMRLHIPLSFVRATQQTVAEDSGNFGGQLVQEATPRVIDGLEPKLMIEELGATVLTGLSGGSIKMPVANSYPFEWLVEGANITGQKGQFTGPTMSPKRAGLLSRGWANAINAAAINGAGGAAPTGILNIAGTNAAADASAVAATFAKIVELQGLIEEDDSTETSLAYLLHPKLKAALKTVSKDTGSGRFLIENNALDGYRFRSTSLVPVGDDTGTPIYPLIFGDFAQMYVGQWGGLSFLVNPYSEDLADSVRITVNTHADVVVALPEAFAINGFLTA